MMYLMSASFPLFVVLLYALLPLLCKGTRERSVLVISYLDCLWGCVGCVPSSVAAAPDCRRSRCS